MDAMLSPVLFATSSLPILYIIHHNEYHLLPLSSILYVIWVPSRTCTSVTQASTHHGSDVKKWNKLETQKYTEWRKEPLCIHWEVDDINIDEHIETNTKTKTKSISVSYALLNENATRTANNVIRKSRNDDYENYLKQELTATRNAIILPLYNAMPAMTMTAAIIITITTTTNTTERNCGTSNRFWRSRGREWRAFWHTHTPKHRITPPNSSTPWRKSNPTSKPKISPLTKTQSTILVRMRKKSSSHRQTLKRRFVLPRRRKRNRTPSRSMHEKQAPWTFSATGHWKCCGRQCRIIRKLQVSNHRTPHGTSKGGGIHWCVERTTIPSRAFDSTFGRRQHVLYPDVEISRLPWFSWRRIMSLNWKSNGSRRGWRLKREWGWLKPKT